MRFSHLHMGDWGVNATFSFGIVDLPMQPLHALVLMGVLETRVCPLPSGCDSKRQCQLLLLFSQAVSSRQPVFQSDSLTD